MIGVSLTAFLIGLSIAAAGTPQQRPAVGSGDTLRPADDFSLSLLGMYRKLIEIEGRLQRYADQHGVDYNTARAVCLFESGANERLTWPDGRAGYFQLSPATRRSVGGADDLEAGVRYLAELQKRYGLEDYAVAAFHAGPANVSRARPMTVETLHYVTAVGGYRNVLRVHEASLRRHAQDLRLATVEQGDDWGSLAERLHVPIVRLRMYNPQLAGRPLVPGSLVAYPPALTSALRIFTETADGIEYRSRIGDTYDTIASALELDMETLRETNHLWYQQEIPPGMRLKLPLEWVGDAMEHRVAAGDTVRQVAARLGTDPWRIIRDNGLLNDEQLTEGRALRVRRLPTRPAAPPTPTSFVMHHVVAGDTLAAIARRYNTTVAAIQSANDMGRRTTIRVGEELRILTTSP